MAYLALGHEVRALGGPFRIWGELFAGRFTEANRHPLYLAILSALAHPDPSYHRHAQALSVGLGLVALLSCWSVARRHLGAAPAAVLALFLAGNGWFVQVASRPTCEPILVAAWAQFVGAVLDGATPGSPRARGAWWRAGCWAGIAYLTKGTGLLPPVVVGLALLVDAGPRAALDRRAWAFGAAYAAASAPLWWRNLAVFGSPIHSFNSRYVWVDRLSDFAEVLAPHADERLPRGALEYLARTTPAALLDRIGYGFADTTFHLLDSMALVSPEPGGPLHVLWVVAALPAIAVAFRWLWRRPRGLARTFQLVHVAFTYAFLVFFNANGGSGRYFLPLAATALGPALAAAIVEAARRAPAGWRSAAAARPAVAWAAAVASTFALAPAISAAEFAQVQAWLLEHLRPGDAYAIDARTRFQLRWLTPSSPQVMVSASWRERPVPEAELVEHLRARRVRYVVLDAAAVADRAAPGDPAGRRYLFYDRLPLEPDGSLPLGPLPDGMRVAWAEPRRPRRWVVLETDFGGARASTRR